MLLDASTWLDYSLPIATIFMAGFTAWLAFETRKLAKSWRETSTNQVNTWREISSNQVAEWFRGSREEIGVQTWMFFEARFDSIPMRRSRRVLAEQLEAYDGSKHDAITEEVLELLESVSALYNGNLIHKELAYCSFSHYAIYWWEASKVYISKERKDKRDNTLYVEFEKFSERMRERDKVSKVDPGDLANFLGDEKRLRVVYPS